MSNSISEAVSVGFASLRNYLQSAFSEMKTGIETKAALETKVVELTATITRQEQEIAGFKADIAAIAQLRTDNTKLTADLATANAEIATLKSDQKSVGERAAEITAAQGVPANQIPITATNGNTSRESLLAQYNELAAKDSVKAGQFYEKNKKELLG